jgi:hypothetical protein
MVEDSKLSVRKTLRQIDISRSTFYQWYKRYQKSGYCGLACRYQYSRQGSQEKSMDYLEFIARVTSHIPDKGQVMIRYYGLYSNAHRGKMKKTHEAANPFLIIEQEEPFLFADSRAESILNGMVWRFWLICVAP